MPLSPLTIFRNPEIAHLYRNIPTFPSHKSGNSDENTFKSAKFALVGSIVTEVHYSSLTFFICAKIWKWP